MMHDKVVAHNRERASVCWRQPKRDQIERYQKSNNSVDASVKLGLFNCV